MRTLSRDTRPDAEAVQISLLRQTSPARKMRLVRSLTATVVGWSRRAIRRADPEADEREVELRFLALHYGENLAAAVRRHLEERRG
ncbi:MAG: hypothetical protein ACYTDY_03115 [Planctomycetota bacterium]|jgi:hypothetical protein